MENIPKLPKSADLEARTARYIMGLVPIAGPILADLIGSRIRNEYQKNLEQWLKDLASDLKQVQDQSEKMYDEPEFVETLAAAAEAARKTAHQEKLDALKNAVLNAVDHETRPDEDLRLRFINYIDQMVPAHLRILQFYDDPQKQFDEDSTTQRPMLMTTSKDIGFIALGWPEDQRLKYNRLVEDLTAWRLLGMLNTTMGTAGGLINDRRYTTPDGQAFIEYVLQSPTITHT